MLSKIVGILGGVCVAAIVTVSEARSSDTAAITDFDAKFRAAIDEHNVPGAAYAIIDDGKVVASKGYGTRALGADLPVTSDTVFRLASVSKTFSAELAAMMVAEGKFSFADKLSNYVPEFRVKTPGHAQRLTVDHILSHTTGLMPNAYDNMLEDGWSISKIMPRFKRLKPMCGPGNCYGYQNIAYAFIEPVIEKTTGQRFEDLMEDRIFKPLGMKDSTIGLEGYLASPNRAEPHVLTRRGWHRTTVKPNYYNVAPAAGVNASIMDLAKWVRAQMGHNEDVLSAEVLDIVTEKRIQTKREMRKRAWRPHLKDAYYGYGWRIYDIGGEDIVMHGGGVSGFRSLIGYNKGRGVGLVMLMNAETRTIDQLGAEFWASIASDPLKQGGVDSAR